MIQIQPDALTVIIDQYTNESGVRKLKEILFEIIAEINLNMLKSMGSMDIPIIVTADVFLIGVLFNKLYMAVVMHAPALGPSFGVDPSGQ